MPTPTAAEIIESMQEDAEAGIASVTSDGQTVTAMSMEDRKKALELARAQEVVTGGNAWGAIGRAKAMPNWE